MAQEKEHKYVVRSDAWRRQIEDGVHIRQGYLSTDPDRSVRIRVTEEEAVLTIKGQNGNSSGNGLNRAEFEYKIPPSDAAELLDAVCTKPILEKTRYRVSVDGLEWEIDEFEGENRGLVLAEVETDSELPEEKPDWVGEEVSADDRFQNANLVQNPFTAWTGKRDGPEPQFHFKRGESVREACVRIMVGEIDNAVSQLGNTSPAPGKEAIHEARKSVKKVRATLRLVRPSVGKAYRAANETLRDVGRTLSSLRDAHALSDSLDAVARDSEVDEGMLQQMHQQLNDLAEERYRQVEEQKGWDEMRDKLSSIKREIQDWNIPDDSSFSNISEGLKTAFRRGRKAFEQACDDPQPELLHEWRKRVKDHWYHMRLLRKSWPEVLDGYIAALDRLETALGDDHNLVLLDQFISEHADGSEWKEASGALCTALRKRREELIDSARAIGHRMYAERTGVMATRVKRAWTAWHHEKHDVCVSE